MMIKLAAKSRSFWIACDANATYSISRLAGKRFSAAWAEAEPAPDVSVYGIVTENEATNLSITTGSMAKYLVVFYHNSNYDTLTEQQIRDSTMLNTGSTALPYEPYGYKIPITCAGQTVPVYLGQTQTVRRVRKLVLNGTENWTKDSDTGTSARYYISISDIKSSTTNLLSTNFSQSVYYEIGTMRGYRKTIIFSVDKTQYPTIADFTAWLATQYSAGTPVTIWYVLAKPETGIVNEPLAKIGDYADEVYVEMPRLKTVSGTTTVDSTLPLKPSVSLTGQIRIIE
jgi:hypothetical protein